MKKWQILEHDLRENINNELYVLNTKGKDTEYVKGLKDAYGIAIIFLDNSCKNLKEKENDT